MLTDDEPLTAIDATAEVADATVYEGGIYCMRKCKHASTQIRMNKCSDNSHKEKLQPDN